MKAAHENIDQILPYGELLRGFVNQPGVSKCEIKGVLRSRGVFFKDNEKEVMVPFLSTLLLSPSEFETLKECQNTREDNLKKSSSRIDLEIDLSLTEMVPEAYDLEKSIPLENSNYKLTKLPHIIIEASKPNIITCNYELERYDLNKSWFESKNIFIGSLTIEKKSDTELVFTKSYTSPESEEVANIFQNHFVQHFKSLGIVNNNKELKKILFKDFTNVERIMFFWKLTSKMEGINFSFVDIEDMEFRPDSNETLPELIEWMAEKKELKLKGKAIHNTFFIKDNTYHPFLQFWGLEAKFEFDAIGATGICVVNFLFKDFASKQENSEFEINISSISITQNTLTTKQKNETKQKLLILLENRKNELYKLFLNANSLVGETLSI